MFNGDIAIVVEDTTENVSYANNVKKSNVKDLAKHMALLQKEN